MERTSYIKKVAFKIFGFEVGALTTTYTEQYCDEEEPINITISKEYHDAEFDVDKKKGNNGDVST